MIHLLFDALLKIFRRPGGFGFGRALDETVSGVWLFDCSWMADGIRGYVCRCKSRCCQTSTALSDQKNVCQVQFAKQNSTLRSARNDKANK